MILVLRLNGEEIVRFDEADPPGERTATRRVEPGATVEFEDGAGVRHRHTLAELAGWAHFSVRVHGVASCQADCAVTDSADYDPQALLSGTGRGIRFQPFFLPGGPDPASLAGQGLFARGLHFSGTVTPGSVRLGCECDRCHRTFQLQSFHAGFADLGYFYSGSGVHTLTVGHQVPGSPPALGPADPAATAALERQLPPAPDGTRFAYRNPLRCPHCAAAYIDFARHPGLREGEYYGNHLIGTLPIRYEPPTDAGRPGGWLGRMLGRPRD